MRRGGSKVLSLALVYGAKLLQTRGRVFMFHSIGDNRHPFHLSLQSFEEFLKKLTGKNVVRLEEWEQKDDFISLSFDDVADSFYYNAFPLLERYHIPFTIFVSSSLLDTKLFLTTDMLKEIAKCDLCTVASHGKEHGFYSSFCSEEKKDDLSRSKIDLERITGREIDMFAFPYGSLYACGVTRKRVVADYYKYGFGTIPSPITYPTLLPKHYLPRIGITDANFQSIIQAL